MTINTDCSVAVPATHGVVQFVAADFRVLYPQFTNPPYTDPMLALYFALATLILDNTCSSPVDNATAREQLLNLLVAHIASITPIGGAASAGMVGPISSATEGSVTVSSGFAARVSQNAAWFAQTQYGFTFWQLTSPFRSFRYIAPCSNGVGAFAGRRGY